ncbi:hypothetical protein MCAG_00916 [Micromonospora sp. ATCC 39149]|uniref:SAF domain-containing protein n=1 Tax=Micromonospora carbonacea TaxID=47853 RepID=A0A7D6CC48_9ACTN|nr:hypothetical protein [Micromonospora sp. ATCC 39149]EEP70589.1 hypothetical protein MCAG_00916 [Micromonospora sp. ATCC 39149]QLJ96963.1 hypothetical protein HZU44_19025 [Micromonospora carbonacea]
MTVGALFESATALLDRRQLTAVWLPLLVFVGTLGTVAVAGVGWGTARTWWSGLGAEGSAALVVALALLTILLGQLLTAWRTGLIRLFSGYWPALPGLTWLGRQLTARHQRVHAGRTAGDPTLFLGYPRRADRVLPTRLGNVLRAAEEHADRYGLDGVAAWPRLYVVLPEQFVAAFSGAATSLEAAVTISVLGAVFALLGGGLAAALLPWYGAVACVWGGIGVALLGYRAAARAAVPYAQLVRTAFDVHRFALLEAMRLELPPSFGAEREQWRQLGKVWYSGWPDSDRASALRYPQPVEQAESAELTGPSRPASTVSSEVSQQPETATPSPASAPSAVAAPGPAGRRWLLPVRAVALVVVLLLGGVAAIVATSRAGSTPVAARAVPAFHVLAAADVRGRPDKKELDELLGRYTVRAVAKGRPLLTRELGPKLPGGALAGRTVVAVPATGLADRIGRGERVTLVVVPAAPETGPPAPPERFVDVLVLDRLDRDPRPLVVAVPSTRLDRLLALTAGGAVHVVVD